jgi:hypothetical protein
MGDVGRNLGVEQGPPLLGLDRREACANDLDPRPVGGCAAPLPASPPHHPKTARACSGRQLIDQACFPDARLAGHQEQMALALAYIVQCGLQFRQLTPAPDEGGAA